MTPHVHRWRLQEPNGLPYVHGICACGDERDYHTAFGPDRDMRLVSETVGRGIALRKESDRLASNQARHRKAGLAASRTSRMGREKPA